jgi:serine/threonine protein kinase
MNDFKIETDTSNYKILEMLGEGTYGRVYKAIQLSTGKTVAVKRTKAENLKEGISAVNLREVCFLKSLRHPGIVSLQSVIVSESNLDLIFEYMQGDLRAYIDSIKHPVPEKIMKKFLTQMLTALYYCHSNRIIHRDLKPQNLLVDGYLNIKIGDFGLARAFQIPMRPYTPSVQTLWYRAPEILIGCRCYTTAIDIWSIGCIFSEMITTFPLFSGSSEMDVILNIFQKLGTPNAETWPEFASFEYPKELPDWKKVTFADVYTELSTEGIDLLSRMICINPEFRISAIDALNHVISMQPYLK